MPRARFTKGLAADAPDKNRTCARGLGSGVLCARTSCKRGYSVAVARSARQSVRQWGKDACSEAPVPTYECRRISSRANAAAQRHDSE